jgi:NAD(P)-dependent dehydrogenase (short-subunit alcohol dehydrogenase family)
MENFNPFSLAGKTILVTGASSGIGRAAAVECAKMGGTMIITGRDRKRLNETFSTISEAAPTGAHLQIIADIAREEEIDRLVAELPKLDGLVCNAGISRPNLVQFIEKSDILETFEINAFAPFLLIQRLLSNKKLNKKASVVFTSSVSGVYSSYVGAAMYSASKGAIHGYIKAMALDVAPRGIRVNSVNPAIVDTGIFSAQTINMEELQERGEDTKNYPLKRFGRPEDVAYAIIYLLSDASSWVTGSNIVIDGGFLLK